MLFRSYIALIFQKALGDLVSEARRGYMGMLWWVLEPVLYMGVFYVVFAIVFQRGEEGFVPFLLVGLVVWKWFATTVPQCANSLMANVGLIRQVYIPKVVLPGMVVTASTMKFLIVFVLLLLFLLVSGSKLSIAWVSLPVLLLLQLFMMLAIGGFLAALVPFLPDLKLIIDNGMMLMFFLSGIFFDISHVSPTAKTYLYLNPMTGMIDSYRHVLLEGVWPDWWMLGKIWIFSCVVFALGWALLKKYDRVYAKVL